MVYSTCGLCMACYITMYVLAWSQLNSIVRSCLVWLCYTHVMLMLNNLVFWIAVWS
jgi:hypothetical protein